MTGSTQQQTVSSFMQTLGSILNESLTAINDKIENAGGSCNDTTQTTESTCINDFCNGDTSKPTLAECKPPNTWIPRVWTKNDVSNLKTQRQEILKELHKTLNAEFKVIGEKNVILSQLQTVGDNIDANKDYIIKKLKKAKIEKQNIKKMLEIANYEYERFYEFKTMIKTIVYGLLIILLVMFLMKQPWFPTTIGVILISIVVAYLILTTLSRFFANMRRNDRSYSVINQTEKNHKYNNIEMEDQESKKAQFKKPATFGEMIFGTNSCDNFIGHKSIPHQTNFNNLKSFRT